MEASINLPRATPAMKPTESGSGAAAPDWEAISEEFHCPLCEYNLRGLTEPRCPECGYRFEWIDLFDLSRRPHPFLFEHHPERNTRSFLRTLLASWQPRRFWQSLHPAQPFGRRRLVIYHFICLATVLVAGGAVAVTQAAAIARLNGGWRATEKMRLSLPSAKVERQTIIRNYGSVQAYLDSYYPDDVSSVLVQRARAISAEDVIYPGGVVVLWPVVSVATLMLFALSMRRSRIRGIHVVRCVVYSADLMVWMSFLPWFVLPLEYNVVMSRGFAISVLHSVWAALVLLLGLVLFTLRLSAAYRHYLRFDRPYLTVMASQFVALLVVLNITLPLILF